MGRVSATLLAMALATGAGAACTPVQRQHGFVADNPATMQVQVGIDTQDTIRARLGTPSTETVFGDATWYYVTSVQESFAFLQPETIERNVLAIGFDPQGVVSRVDRFGLERGQIVNFADAETPTRGRELGILEQILGTIGRGAPVGLGDEEERNAPRRR
ncbi:MAG: outer membrane protein assembly factor BamE [Alphaproteobacteria bacterium]|jgi:outer membrane protein assembly factor BamE (lipoprotein component of BamABCDE complex)|nr:outer membrane protein assembly factor BamE [Alphaproteobacteria bacterium]